MSKRNGKAAVIIIAIIAIAAIVGIMMKTGAFEYLKDFNRLRDLIQGLGWKGPIIYILLYTVVCLTMISVLPLTIAGGLAFGIGFGILWTAIGAGIGLSLSFLIARYLAHDTMQKKFGHTPAFKKINQGVEEEGLMFLATTRLIPVFPFGIQNYVYGLTKINFIQYALLSTIFILPGTSVFVILAGAVASGDMAYASKMAVGASLLFFVITVVPKIVIKKIKEKKAK